MAKLRKGGMMGQALASQNLDSSSQAGNTSTVVPSINRALSMVAANKQPSVGMDMGEMAQRKVQAGLSKGKFNPLANPMQPKSLTSIGSASGNRLRKQAKMTGV